ncbi:5-methylcytosine restriction system specificity protein McrC [Corynebacterium heidelbergense]|uniref:5-methylcytosine-specific restriction endonuclease system specificity protein McrC n=1 Tax=Corynebacterium heidelbergense TaxID=2055947 RepID=A0A364VCW8_9CORY|nr:hypothetical protein [Corynebacterium heidelbergense]RAV34499.1 hypothetical protein CWC39_02930 [Corynebacterium heidelbergense]WCZ36147.1 5-methylcytosine-specific restriction enzyme subunit McrC [Corynebacterium heidelbergense]
MNEDETFGVSRYVPVRSLWLLQLYASELYRCGLATDADVEDPDVDIPLLVAGLLCDAVEQRLQRELTIGFTRTQRDMSRIRGKINVIPTVRGQLMEKGLVNCTFNDLTVNSPVNRYLLRALDRAVSMLQTTKRAGLRSRTLTPQQGAAAEALSARVRRLYRTLANAGVPFHANAPEPKGRLARQDRKPVVIATLLLQLLIPSPGTGRAAIRRSDVSEEALRRLFERALLGIYRHHLAPEGWVVRGSKTIKWAVDEVAEGDKLGKDAKTGGGGVTGAETLSSRSPVLPLMRTDITLRSPGGRLIIVDAKFANMAARGPFSSKPTLPSAYLYQLHAYVTMAQLEDRAVMRAEPCAKSKRRSSETTSELSAPQLIAAQMPGPKVAGAMVFAALGTQSSTDFPEHQEWVMNGHPITFAALDLTRSAKSIREAVLGAVGPVSG